MNHQERSMRSRKTVAVVAMIGLSLAVSRAGIAQDQPATAPTTEPATAMLAGGIVFTPPAEWTPAGHGGNGKILAYQAADESGVMAVNVDQQEASLANNDAAAIKIGQMVSKQIRDNAAKSNGSVQIIDPPKLEKDDRFFLRVHHRFKKG